jgi:transposase-like protein
MHEHTALTEAPSNVVWENLEGFARLKVQEFLQRLLEEEVTELLGRTKSQRRPTAEEEPLAGPTAPVYRNGYGKPRRLTTACGSITVQRPRVRGLEGRFESRVLPLFQRRTRAVDRLLPELYLHGLAEGDFDQALRGLLGEQAPISAASIARLKAGWQVEYHAWKERSLAACEVVYLWVDGIYVKAGLEKEKAALLVVLGALRDGSKVVLAVESGHRESTESWSAVLRDLKQRGLPAPQLVVGDGNLGIWGALANVYPSAGEQRCWNHRMVNVLDRIPKKRQPEAREFLRGMMYADTRETATRRKEQFQAWCRKQGCAPAGELLDHDWDRLVAYYAFPLEHWKHLRTTNPVESPFAAVRLRTTAAKRYKRVENATAVLWKTLLLAERTFRRLNAPELLAEVAAGVRFENGVRLRALEVVEITHEKFAA